MEWRPIPGWPAYEASEDGQIRGGPKNVVCRAYLGRRGYLQLSLRGADNKWHCRRVNRLVAMAFYGPPPTAKHQAAHNDGSVDNNHWRNLRWATCKDNLADRWRHGTMIIGGRNGRAKLDVEDIDRAKDLRRQGVSFAQIGAQLGVSKRQAMRIIKREHWG